MARIVTRDHDPVGYAVRHWQHDVNGPPPVDLRTRPDSGVEVEARVDHGRWIVGCPTDGCNGAYYFNPSDPRFWCVYCDTGWHTVVMPSDRDEVETVLLERPARETRNWRPGETVAQLKSENRDRGVV